MDSQRILVIFLVLIPRVVRSEGSQGRWRTDGHSYNLRDKLVFGRGGGGNMQRRVVGNTRRNSAEFAGGKYFIMQCQSNEI